MRVRYLFQIALILVSCVFSMNGHAALPDEGLAAEGNHDWQKAVYVYLGYLAEHPDSLEVWLRVGSIEHQLKNYPVAIDAYKHALHIAPKDASIHKTLSEVYSELRMAKEAFQEINTAVQLEPNNANYLIARAKIANWNKALAVALDSDERILTLNQHTGPSKQALLSEIGSLHNQLHQYKEAIATYRALLQITPRDARVYQHISQAYAAMKEPKQALDAIHQALLLEPHCIEFLHAKAMLATWLKDNKLALATYEEILKQAPNNMAAQKGIALAKNQLHPTSFVTKPLNPLEQAIYDANEAAVQHDYVMAAQAMKKAIALKPHDPGLYKKLSEIYASAKRPKDALQAINKATTLAPKNIAYWRARAKLAAWANEKNQILDSYLMILSLKPLDEDALLNLAHTLASDGKTDAAIKVYRQFLCLYPRSAEGWLQYAEVESWTGSYIISFNALQHYVVLKGETFAYCATKARILALIGRFHTALVINKPLVAQKSKDPYLLSTQVIALTKANQTKKAVQYLDTLEVLYSNDRQVKGLKNIERTPLRANANLETDYTGASDTTRILDIPVTGQYFLTPVTSLLFWGLYERATAAATSPLRAVDGRQSIMDDSAMLGFTTQVHALNLKGQVGALHVQQANNHAIYDALVNANVGETAQVTLESLHNLFRPYLVPQTPKLISLQVMETRIGGALQWQPWVQKYLNTVLSYSELSDNNNYLHANIWPKARVYGSQHWLVNVGVDADLWHFRRRANDGYYSPTFFNGYEGTVELYYGQNENIGYGASGGFGLQKDETFPHYYYEEDLALQMFFGIFTDWELQIKSGLTIRNNPSNNYKCWTVGGQLTRRF